MASQDTVQYAKVAAASTTYDPLEPNESGGRLRVQFFEVSSTSTTENDTVNLCKVPKDARILGVQIGCTDLSDAAGTLDVGDATDPNRLAENINIANAVVGNFQGMVSPDAVPTTVGYGYKYTAETTIIATFMDGAPKAGTLAGCIVYVVD